MLAAVIGVAVAPLPSQAKPKRQAVNESFSVKTAAAAGTVTNASIVTSFPLPGGVTAAKGCKGKIVASAKVGGKKKKTWSGKLAADGAGCTATISVKLAGSALGKAVSLTFKFDGNSELAPFKKKVSLLIAPPTPVPAPTTPQSTITPLPLDNDVPPLPQNTTPVDTTPTTPPATTPTGPVIPIPEDNAKGKWASDESTPRGNLFKWTITPSHDVPGGIQANNFKWTCSKGTSTEVSFAQFRFDDGASLFNGVVGGTYTYLNGATAVTYTASIQLLGDNKASGTITANGKWDYGQAGVWDCSTTETFTGYRYAVS